MNIEKTIFKNSTLIPDKLLKFGFTKTNKTYTYTINILNDKFCVWLSIDPPNDVCGKIYDIQTQEEYTNYRVENFGSYSNIVLTEYIAILKNIKDTCFITNYFKSNQANRLTKYIKDNFAIEPEFLWEKYPNYGVFRNSYTDKWLAVILNIDRSKIMKNESGEIEIIDIKVSKDVSSFLKKPGFYPAYHMNKKSWITITLDDTVKDSEIIELLNDNYELSPAPNNWVIPANPKYFDISTYFANNSTILWHQSIKASTNDTVYIYITEPVAAIMYKCKVKKANILTENGKKEMELQLEKQYSKDQFSSDLLKSCGVSAIRSQRAITNKLKNLLERKS